MHRIFILLLVFVVTGCAYLPQLRIKQYDLLELGKKDFYVITEDAPAPEGVVSGRQAMNRAISIGKEPKEEKIKISSPAERIEKKLSAHLLNKGQELRTISFKGEEKPGDIIGWMQRQGIESGVVLDVEMGGWGMEPHPKDSVRYIVWINARMSLRDLGRNEALAQYTCYSDTSLQPVDEAPTKYNLLKDDGALVKKMFAERTEVCAQEIIDKALTEETE